MPDRQAVNKQVVNNVLYSGFWCPLRQGVIKAETLYLQGRAVICVENSKLR